MNLAYTNLTEEDIEVLKDLVFQKIQEGGYTWKVERYKEILQKLSEQ